MILPPNGAGVSGEGWDPRRLEGKTMAKMRLLLLLLLEAAKGGRVTRKSTSLASGPQCSWSSSD